MLIIVMVITITNYTHTDYHLSKFYSYAESSDNNKEKVDEKEEKGTTIDKEDQEQTKDKDNKESDEKEKSETSYIDPAYRSFFPIKRIVIPQVYETIANGQTYRFNVNNPNDKVQVDK